MYGGWRPDHFFYKRGGITSDGPWEEACCCTANFGASGVPSLAKCGMDQYVKDHVSPTDPELGDKICTKWYMDDLFNLETTLSIAIQSLQLQGIIMATAEYVCEYIRFQRHSTNHNT